MTIPGPFARNVERTRTPIVAGVRPEPTGSGGDPPASSQTGTITPATSANAIWDAAAYPAPSSFFTERPPKRNYLLRDLRRESSNGVLVCGKVAAIVAEGGVGKTQSVSDLAVAVSTGTNWLGCINAAKPGKVLLVLAEEDREEAQRRAYTSCRSAKPPADGMVTVLALHGKPCSMLERDRQGNVSEAAFLPWLRSYLEAHGPFALVILDPLTRFAGPDAEKDNAEGTRFVQALESLVVPSGGAAIMVAHHTNKLGRDGKPVGTAASRGSSSLTDGFRWVATMGATEIGFTDSTLKDRLGEIVTVSFTKSNYTKKGAPILLRRAERGALVPLDETDHDIIRQATDGASTRAAKTADREAQRDRVRLERAAKDVAERDAKEAAKVAARRLRDAEDDETARRLLAESPTAALRNLIAQFKRDRACGEGRATDALKRVRPAVPAVPTVPAVPPHDSEDAKDASLSLRQGTQGVWGISGGALSKDAEDAEGAT